MGALCFGERELGVGLHPARAAGVERSARPPGEGSALGRLLGIAPSRVAEGVLVSSVDGLNNVARFLTGWFARTARRHDSLIWIDSKLLASSATGAVDSNGPYSGNRASDWGASVVTGADSLNPINASNSSLEVLFWAYSMKSASARLVSSPASSRLTRAFAPAF